MPTYSIEGPDGHTYSIEGPEGATREQVIAAIQRQIGPGGFPQGSPRPARSAFDQATTTEIVSRAGVPQTPEMLAKRAALHKSLPPPSYRLEPSIPQAIGTGVHETLYDIYKNIDAIIHPGLAQGLVRDAESKALHENYFDPSSESRPVAALIGRMAGQAPLYTGAGAAESLAPALSSRALPVVGRVLGETPAAQLVAARLGEIAATAPGDAIAAAAASSGSPLERAQQIVEAPAFGAGTRALTEMVRSLVKGRPPVPAAPEAGLAAEAGKGPSGVPEFPKPAPSVTDARRATKAVTKIVDWTRSQVAPMSLSKESATAGMSLRHRLAQGALSYEQAANESQYAREAFGKLGLPANVALLDAAEAPGQMKRIKPEYRPAIVALRNLHDRDLVDVQALGTGKLEAFVRDYMPHLFEEQDQASVKDILTRWFSRTTPAQRDMAASMFGRRPAEGNRRFLQHRTGLPFADLVASGYKPLGDNIVDWSLMQHRATRRYIDAHHFLQDMIDKGLAEFVKTSESAPEGWITPKDNLFARYRPSEQGLVMDGHYYLHPDAAMIVDRWLGSGLRGNPLFDAAHAVSRNSLGYKLGASAFHGTMSAVNGSVSALSNGLQRLEAGARNIGRGEFGGAAKDFGTAIKETGNAASVLGPQIEGLVTGAKMRHEMLNPGSIAEPRIQKAVALALRGGARVRPDTFWDSPAPEAFMQAVKEGRLFGWKGAAMRAPGAAQWKLIAPIMRHQVPLMKLSATLKMLETGLSRLGPDASQEVIDRMATDVVNSVDDRFGQMIYDNRFWNQTAKDLGMLSMISLGWNAGDVAELGGAPIDVLRTPWRIKQGRPILSNKIAFTMALPVVVGLYGAMLNYMFGRKPQTVDELFHVPTGGINPDGSEEKVQIPSYMRDVYAWQHDPTHTAIHKLNPMMSTMADLFSNRDFRNVQIANPDDPWATRQLDRAQFALKNMYEPIAVENLMRLKETEHGPAFGKKAAAAFAGIGPAPRRSSRTPAENMIADILGETPRKPMSAQEHEDYAARREAITKGRVEGATPGEMVRKMRDLGATRSEIRAGARAMRTTWDTDAFGKLTLTDAGKVWDIATPEERARWHVAYERKLGNYLRENRLDAAALAARRRLMEQRNAQAVQP